MTGLAVSLAGLAVAATFSPARLLTGAPPALPAVAVGWGQASVELSLAVDGSVLSVKPLGASNPFLELVVEAAKSWTFTPARADGVPTETHVLLTGIFRPPELMAAAPTDSFVAPSPSRGVPRPTTLVPPFYPPTAVGDAVVVVEVHVDANGKSDEISVARSAGAFDSAALDAARQWAFEPAVHDGVAVPAYVYVLFGFREPVVIKESAGREPRPQRRPSAKAERR